MHSAVVNILANASTGTQSTKQDPMLAEAKSLGDRRVQDVPVREVYDQLSGLGGVVLGPKPRSYRYTSAKEGKETGSQERFIN